MTHAGPASGQPIGYTFQNEDLHALNLRQDSQPAPAELVGSTGIRGVQAVALGPDGLLYVAAEELPQTRRLSTVDLQTLDVELIGDFGLPTFVDVDLTFDDLGRLWLATGGALFEVDPATGQATQVSDSLGLVALAAHDGMLFGLATDADRTRWSMVTVDLTTGQALTLVEEVDFESSIDGLDIAGPAAMDFGPIGGLWVAVPYLIPMGDPPTFATEIYFFADPGVGVPTSRSSVIGIDQPFLLSLGVTDRAPGITEVPTLGTLGATILGLLLLTFGCIRLRWRRHPRPLSR